jgi:acyl-[acyl-carrier-protein]-phospholipid O-acyltransferase/long-chain-fatty-acid--[acyl-carrier-protein] ligase
MILQKILTKLETTSHFGKHPSILSDTARSIQVNSRANECLVICHMKTTMYKVLAWFLRNLLKLTGKIFYRVRISGQCNIPSQGGALLVANHVSYLDFMLIVCSVPRYVSFVMNADIYNKPSLRWLLRGLHCIPVSPRGGKNDFESFNRAVSEQINSGRVVIIFAEGTVTRTGQMLEFKKGVSHLSALIKAPVIPIHLHNVQGTPLSFRAGSKKMEKFNWRNLRRDVLVNIGVPMDGPVSAFALRQRIKELEVQNFNSMLSASKTLDILISESLHRQNEGSWKHGGEKISFYELNVQLAKIGQALKPLLAEDDRVALLLPKCHYAYLLNLWLLLNNKTIININPEFSNEERFYVLNKARVRTLITTMDLEFARYSPNADRIIYTEHLHESIEKGVQLNVVCRKLNSLGHYVMKAFRSSKNIEDPVTIIFERNEKEGELKCVSLSHRNLLAVLQGLRQIYFFPRSGVMMSNLPLYQSYGFVFELLIPVMYGLNSHLISSNIQADEFIGEMESAHPSLVIATPKQINAIAALSQMRNIPYLTHIFTADLHPSHHDIETLSNRGIEVYVCAGKNETSSVFAVNLHHYRGRDIAGKLLEQENNMSQSIGKPLPGVAAKICDASHHELGCDEKGCLWLRGACIAETKGSSHECGAAIVNGWFNTGLRGHIDQHGFIHTEEI